MENKNKTVVKTMTILNLFQQHERLSLNDMVRFSGVPKTSVHRMVGSLEEMGLLKRDGSLYTLGLVFLQFGQLVAERLDIRTTALPIMRDLRDEVGEAVNLIIRDDEDAIYIEKIDTHQPVRVYTRMGRRAPLYAGACPRILLTYMPKSELEMYLDRVKLSPVGDGTITDRDELISVLNESRRLGYTISHSELENDSSAIGAPIFDHEGQVVAGLSIAGPTSRFQAERLPELVEKVIEAAFDISVKIGYRSAVLRGGGMNG